MKKKQLKNIFLSSIHQNAGKTTMSLGLLKALLDRKLKTAFMKPVGQEVVNVGKSKIDKDAYLMADILGTGRRYKDTSPVTIGRGYTEKYINRPHRSVLEKAIVKSFRSLTRGKDAIVVEGTGHAGVGSVIDFSNADVAALLESKVIIVSGGGIGKSIDEIMLNKALFDVNNVEILGVIINKVRHEKYDKIKKFLTKGLERKGVRVLGVIPIQPLLMLPTVEQIVNRLNLKIVCGKAALGKRVKNTIVAAMEPHNMIHYLKDGTLVLTSGDRVDNILAAVSSHLVRDGRSFHISGIILTGGLTPNPSIVDLLEKSQIPIMITEEDTYTVAGAIEHMICKIQRKDKDKIEEATRLVNKYVDVKGILESF